MAYHERRGTVQNGALGLPGRMRAASGSEGITMKKQKTPINVSRMCFHCENEWFSGNGNRSYVFHYWYCVDANEFLDADEIVERLQNGELARDEQFIRLKTVNEIDLIIEFLKRERLGSLISQCGHDRQLLVHSFYAQLHSDPALQLGWRRFERGKLEETAMEWCEENGLRFL